MAGHDVAQQLISHLSPDDDADSDHVGDSGGDSKPGSPSDLNHSSEKGVRSSLPLQKRRRVTRACDECRRKKIKCDGKQPCTHCTVYSYECTYDQPSNRRRNPAPQYIEALENRLNKAEAILRSVLPSIDLDDPKFDVRGIDQLIESAKADHPTKASHPRQKLEDDAQIQSMVERTGSLDLDDQGRWDFHGHSSGFAFMRKFRAQFGESFQIEPRLPSSMYGRNLSQFLESPKSASSSAYDLPSPSGDLPSKDVAMELCRNSIDDCCALMRPIHRPSFFRKLHKLYDTDPENYSDSETRFLPLLYAVMALGCLFAKTEHEKSMLDTKGYQEAMEQGYRYFNAARQLVEITECRDLTSLQTLAFMIVFLQSTAKLATCYSYLGIALRGCCRLGLHRNVPARFNTIEMEERKRLFWLIRKMDSYVGAMLGLPQMLSDEDIDQELPAEVDDDYILEDGFKPMPSHVFPLIKATNAHTGLTNILRKVVRYIYPIKGLGNVHIGESYSISHKKIRELENDLQEWMDALPAELRPSENDDRELSRVQQLLRMSYAHVQMMMYRPFLHYVANACGDHTLDKRSFACAAACVNVARNIVHITTEMKRRGLLVGAYWFVMYTTYFAILSLLFFVLENPESPTGKEILKDAMEGRDTLASLTKRSLAADRCSTSLASLFAELPEKLKQRRSSLQSSECATSKKRAHHLANPFGQDDSNNAPTASVPRDLREGVTPSRAKTMPRDFLAKIAKRNSIPDPSMHSPFGFNSPGLPDSSSRSSIPGFNGSSAGNSPATIQTDFQQPLENPNILDFKSVMFPSENPFAYPNQPISTLEDAQFMSTDQRQDSFSTLPNDNEIYNIPNTGLGGGRYPQELTFDALNMSMFNNSLPQSFVSLQNRPPQQQQGRQFSGPMGPNQVPDMGQIEEPVTMTGLQQMPAANAPQGTVQPQEEDYWSQMNRGGMRTGLTPGGVNLDELFGGEVWSNAWGESGFVRQ